MTTSTSTTHNPQEWVFVPIPSTDEMEEAAEKAQLRHFVDDRKRGGHDPELSTRAIFRAMVQAAPKHPHAPSSTVWLTQDGKAYGRVSDEQIEVMLAGALQDVRERSGLARYDDAPPNLESDNEKLEILALAGSIFDFKPHKQDPENLEKYLHFARKVLELHRKGK